MTASWSKVRHGRRHAPPAWCSCTRGAPRERELHDRNGGNRNVLLIGLDPHAVPGVDAALVDTAIAIGQQRFEAQHIPAELCLVKPDATAAPQIIAHLTRKEYACVVIGGGLRKPEGMLELFERVINLVRQHAAGAAIAFNTNPTDSVDAALRWLA
jgi:hypothetical protein